MPQFATDDGVEIAFIDEGAGDPIVLVHGFASNKEINWVVPGWVATLTRAGRRAIALDNRGHGASGKVYEPAAYHSAIMAEDVRALLDHLRLTRADVMGYSMGARITAFLALAHPARSRQPGTAAKMLPAGAEQVSGSSCDAMLDYAYCVTLAALPFASRTEVPCRRARPGR